jgi:hypothetical protein
LSQFCAYWGDDDSISEDEWKKLNNSEEWWKNTKG